MFGKIIAAILGIAMFLYVSADDYEMAKKEQTTYCQNVKSGKHGDYKGSFKEECK